MPKAIKASRVYPNDSQRVLWNYVLEQFGLADTEMPVNRSEFNWKLDTLCGGVHSALGYLVSLAGREDGISTPKLLRRELVMLRLQGFPAIGTKSNRTLNSD